MPEAKDLPRRIGFWGGSAIMVGIIVGSGIFRAPPGIAREMGSPALILSLWVAGGVLSLFGAFAYAELGAMFPHSGGIYVFLHRGLGGMVAFVFGWTYMILTKPFAAAGIIMVFSEHLLKLCGATPGEGVDWRVQTVSVLALVVLTWINVLGTRLGAGLAIALTGLKVVALLLIIGLGVILARGSASNFSAVPVQKPFFQALAPVLALILFAYDGWSDVASVAGEVKDAARLLPRILLVGTAVTIALYVGVNIVYLSLVPITELRNVPTIAPLVMERLVGQAAGTAVTVIILISTFGASHGSVITGARVTYAQARDGLLFRFLGHVHPRFETPDVSLWIQAVLSSLAVLYLGKFEDLSEGFVFTMWIFYGLSAAAVIVLRIRRPDLERPYRCLGYPFVPALFILATLGMTVLAIRADPRKTLPWLAVFAAGIPAYWIWRRLGKSRPPVESAP